MFSKILIANRGEIACRVIRTAKKMGIATVAVYSDADQRALHVREADEAVRVGPAAANQSYLVIDNIINACKETGAEAVHPGYGFLSENPAFARALRDAGIAFIGPNIKAIEAMGDKIESKRFADAAGVNTVPGYLGEIQLAEDAVGIADEIGYPVMIKASAGGGGKGMRIAHSRDEVKEGFELARAEAKASFGDERVFIEKFIVNPRHIEIQVLGDKHGHVIYLGERECSIQRRNQKVVEEAPSPFLDEATRKAMGEQAVALSKAVDYESAGTVEFIVDQDRNFYFLEMNTRLQVEHPVTELITGVDLVEQMIRVAAGEPLALAQEDVVLNGWAIESRVYAEDPYRNFMPSTGRLVRYRPPVEGTNDDGFVIRNDTGVFEGGEISIYYDPMIAKLCTWAPTRDQATEHMSQALDAFYIDGIQHNIPFVAAIMRHPRWQSGSLTTGFIAEEFPDGFQGAVPDAKTTLRMAAVATFLDHVENERKREISGQLRGLPVEFSRERTVQIGEEWHSFFVDDDDEGDTIFLRSRSGGLDIELTGEWQPGQAVWRGAIDGLPMTVQVRRVINGYRLFHGGIDVVTRVFTAREAQLAKLMPKKLPPDTSRMLICPMPGLVVSIAVEVGDEVKVGQAVCVVEAMKMQNVLRAERDASVKAINASPGATLSVGDVIMEFE
ncbi:propionyl-CoA carboxylase alpha chain [Rhodoligotrophos appendicifer]|uniref:acetyl-CoA carboxylase biotin carboxylase subunit n=1 Tax=Rhodoligotrophos appendicifer TaxID=987056 RepID=UPI001186C444|nr:acetyl/propionyl/methylcrotonyl-CoA carboxylase subunit alpha [Rhodoligotrophos appendicifer]